MPWCHVAMILYFTLLVPLLLVWFYKKFAWILWTKWTPIIIGWYFALNVLNIWSASWCRSIGSNLFIAMQAQPSIIEVIDSLFMAYYSCGISIIHICICCMCTTNGAHFVIWRLLFDVEQIWCMGLLVEPVSYAAPMQQVCSYTCRAPLQPLRYR